MSTDAEIPPPPHHRARWIRPALGVGLLVESGLAALASITLLLVSRMIERSLGTLLGTTVADSLAALVVLGALLSVCLFVAGLAMLTDIGERRPLARVMVLIAAAAHLVVGLGQAGDISGATAGRAVGLVVATVLLLLVSGALAREWWRMRTAGDRSVMPSRSDR
jgi:hypothetical protein